MSYVLYDRNYLFGITLVEQDGRGTFLIHNDKVCSPVFTFEMFMEIRDRRKPMHTGPM